MVSRRQCIFCIQFSVCTPQGDSSKSKRSRLETDAQLDGPKSKRSKREPASETTDANGTPDDAKAKKSKKTKKIKNDKTTDPVEDTGLSDQTRKGSNLPSPFSLTYL
jgi:hypothetical protein